MKKEKIGAISGMIAAIIFPTVFILFGMLRTNYSSVSMYVSELSIGAYGYIQIINFLIFGLLLFIFSISLPKSLGKKLLIIVSVCFFLSGPFVTDFVSTGMRQVTILGTVHGILGGIVFLLIPIICSNYYFYFKKWFVLSLSIFFADILFVVANKLPFVHGYFIGYFGLIQRLVLILFMIWLFLFAYFVYKKS